VRDSGTVEEAQRDLGEELAVFRGTSGYSQAALARLVITGRGGPGGDQLEHTRGQPCWPVCRRDADAE